jgi:hypothetical protein
LAQQSFEYNLKLPYFEKLFGEDLKRITELLPKTKLDKKPEPLLVEREVHV